MNMLNNVLSKPPPDRAPPPVVSGTRAWLRKNLFANWQNTLATLLVVAVLLRLLPWLYQWGVGRAVFSANLRACRALDYGAACWGVVTEKYRVIFFGSYPFAEHWRPAVASLVLAALLVGSSYPSFWRKQLALAWTAGLVVLAVLMRGGILGLSAVDVSDWGGLPLTLLLTVVGTVFAFPLAIMVALGRRSRMPIIRKLCVLYIELVRGVPLITVLFMASFLIPLLVPEGVTLPGLARVQIAIILFEAAYLAEVVRGGLQALSKGQVEAASALGLTYWQTNRKIILPQALRLVIPALVNNFIGALKSTSLVIIVGLHDLTGALQLALSDADWRPFALEGYLFIGLVYFVLCFSMSRYSQWLERRLNRSTPR